MTDTPPGNLLTMHDLESLRAALLRVREDNIADQAAARATIGTLVAEGSVSDPTLREDVANAEYMTQDATSIIAMVDGALQRIVDGTYGICTNCGERIPEGRLEARPYADVCIDCAR